MIGCDWPSWSQAGQHDFTTLHAKQINRRRHEPISAVFLWLFLLKMAGSRLQPSWLSTLFALVTVLTFAVPSQALYFYVNGKQRKCFYEELPQDTLVVGEYLAMLNAAACPLQCRSADQATAPPQETSRPKYTARTRTPTSQIPACPCQLPSRRLSIMITGSFPKSMVTMADLHSLLPTLGSIDYASPLIHLVLAAGFRAQQGL